MASASTPSVAGSARGRLPGYRIDNRLIRVRIEDVEALFHPIPIGDRIVRRRRLR